jgi:hypothetical protein
MDLSARLRLGPVSSQVIVFASVLSDMLELPPLSAGFDSIRKAIENAYR